MLSRTFCHIPGIGEKTERRIWSEGIRDWTDALSDPVFSLLLPADTRTFATSYLERSIDGLEREDIRFFDDRLRHNNRWRLFSAFRQRAVFLDIETTGLNPPHDHITMITLFDGKRTKTYIHGMNLTDFTDDIMSYPFIVTFNGMRFDLPIIERYFGIHLPQVHLDLRYVLKSLGFTGGLKACERIMGIDRGDLAGVDGFTAVLLWRKYREGCIEALESLIAYNVEDTVNLEKLMVFAYNRKVEQLSFPSLTLPLPRKRVVLPYSINRDVLREVLFERIHHFGGRKVKWWPDAAESG